MPSSQLIFSFILLFRILVPMIKVKHPIPEKNIEQEKLLNLIPEETLHFFGLVMSHTNACYIYYNRDVEPTYEDYLEWLTGLPHTLRSDMKALGFGTCKNMLSLRRYLLEKNDVGMEEFIKNLMGSDDYTDYIYHLNKPKTEF